MPDIARHNLELPEGVDAPSAAVGVRCTNCGHTYHMDPNDHTATAACPGRDPSGLVKTFALNSAGHPYTASAFIPEGDGHGPAEASMDPENSRVTARGYDSNNPSKSIITRFANPKNPDFSDITLEETLGTARNRGSGKPRGSSKASKPGKQSKPRGPSKPGKSRAKPGTPRRGAPAPTPSTPGGMPELNLEGFTPRMTVGASKPAKTSRSRPHGRRGGNTERPPTAVRNQEFRSAAQTAGQQAQSDRAMDATKAPLRPWTPGNR